jgi:predicted nuclease of predicted toxin-antitoxin system
MGISGATVRYLLGRGHDAVHLADEGLYRLPDAEIVLKARAEDRIILTVDLDFAHLTALSEHAKPSVIIFRFVRKTPDRIDVAVERCVAEFARLLGEGAIVSVAETLIRARALPLRPREQA